jgi:(1->4)-alpha-D-glucan 1-alpha-D-glucosylmutase
MSPTDDLFRKTSAAIADRTQFPAATYRLQFHAGFQFRDALRIMPYLRDLGITHCYASPYLMARPGSTHGYDIINHNVLNPEIGTPAEYETWVAALHEHGLDQILDIVPNHMGIVGNENAWWNDVLENGQASPFAGYFDIAWTASPRPELQGKILLPILGDPYGKVLESRQIRLEYAAGTFTLNFFEHRFPVAPRSYGLILGHDVPELERRLPPEDPALVEYQSILTAVSHLPRRSETEPAKVTERQREKEVIKRRLAALTESSPPVLEFIERNVALFNGSPNDPRSFDLLDELLDDQAYRLSFWRVASDEINYRRFFDINELAALSMEKPEVMQATHDLVFRLLREGKVNGLRIDHPDGLFDPKQYLDRLQEQFVVEMARRIFASDPDFRGQEWESLEGPIRERITETRRQGRDNPLWRPLYVVVEKILGANEPFPEDWPTFGTSGYAFLNMVNRLFVEASHGPAFTLLYQRWIRDDTPFAEIVYQKKFLILQVALSSELHTLAYQLDRLAQKSRRSRDFTLNSLRHALREVIACFPVYRSYITDDHIHESDRRYVQGAINRAKFKNPALSGSIFDYVRDMLLLKYPESATEEDRAEQRRFVGNFQQVTAPVMAKGLEDTAFYVYNRLVSVNEVGGFPDRFGIAPEVLHRYCQERQARWPYSFSASSTHDTKRSEDVRARINVLSELPGEWEEHLARWSELNRPHRAEVDEAPAPDANEEYLLYQTLLGAWPLEPYEPYEYMEFVGRIQAYMAKALNEAKVHTSWINPNPAYDDAVRQFVARILDESQSGAFLDDLRTFQRRISHYGLLNALSQTLLKITAPGVPDTYQGTELWDFSLVDPDNRRPVDFEIRSRLLRELKERAAQAGPRLVKLARELIQAKEDGRVKLYVTWCALTCRRDHPGLFSTGDYTAAEIHGAKQPHVFAFLRRQDRETAVCVVPRLITKLARQPGALPLGKEVWQDTTIHLPGLERGLRFVNVFTGEILTPVDRADPPALAAADVLARFPVALLLGQAVEV